MGEKTNQSYDCEVDFVLEKKVKKIGGFTVPEKGMEMIF
jgi:hypothetical protein